MTNDNEKFAVWLVQLLTPAEHKSDREWWTVKKVNGNREDVLHEMVKYATEKTLDGSDADAFRVVREDDPLLRENAIDVDWHQPVHTEKYVVNGIPVSQQFDGHGNHRLVVFHPEGHDFSPSEWTLYPDFSAVEVKDLKVVGSSEYWAGSFPRVFTLKPAEETR